MNKDFENLQVGDELEDGVFLTEEMLKEEIDKQEC